MGDRATVSIWNHAASPEEAPVVLDTHWGASTVTQDVIEAMKRGKSRWNDPAYLSRVIFCQMLCGDLEPLSSTTGYGIMTKQADDARVKIIVDCDRNEIIVKERGQGWKTGNSDEKYTFNEFIKLGEEENVDANRI